MHTTDNPFGILILGPHRSGTSLVTRLVAELGFQPGSDLVPPRSDNPEGYWEHRGAVDNHNRFLRDVGRSWSDPTPMKPGDFSGPEAARARSAIAEIVDADFRGPERWVLKDPRLCRLLPLWQDPLDQWGESVAFVHVVRSPLASAASLHRRDAVRLETALLLWLRHVLEAELTTRGRPRLWLSMESIADNPGRETDRLAAWIEQVVPGFERDPDLNPSKIFKADLVHHRSDDGSLGPFPWIEKAYEVLQSWASSGETSSTDELDQIRREIAVADRLMFGHPLTAQQDINREWNLQVRSSIERVRDETRVHRTETDHLRTLVGETQQMIAHLENKHGDLLNRSLQLTAVIEKEYFHQVRKNEELQETAEIGQGDIKWLRSSLKQSQDDCRSLTEQLNQLTAEAEVRNLEIEKAAEHITALEQEMAEKNRELQRVAAFAADLEQEVRRQTDRAENLATALEQTESERHRLSEDLEASRAESEALGQAMTELYRRLSWRMTAPLRSIRGLFPSRRP